MLAQQAEALLTLMLAVTEESIKKAHHKKFGSIKLILMTAYSLIVLSVIWKPNTGRRDLAAHRFW
jgi:hypothetical protein